MAHYTLGIETSCDETSVALLRDGREILANIIYSQAHLHDKYGGVVPEVASRNHIRKLPFVVQDALERAKLNFRQISLVGATYGPGLVGPLLVGLSYAKAIAYALEKPFVGVNHLEGHIFAHYLENFDASPPFVALLVSGGHTLLVDVRAYGDYRVLGETRDDAAGEAFDKVGKLLGLGYPAGAALDRLARQGNPKAIALPRPMLDSDSLEFSFAGLKTAIVYYLRDHSDADRADIAASFQEAVVDVLTEKTLQAARQLQTEKLVVVGGVAANSRLRERLLACRDYKVFFPKMELCTDNAAMIAACAHFRNTALGQNNPLELAPEPSLRL
ncbi:tRNA (adenosine(37)-N6)-threonylcarbamoyltransferase complex transferase subunit TsaD [Candidatus Acetothermia bacterium]|jgi:N6-L-threonylcarbamoyladenine synthase|nr:tRNA (adenosine(37)-N6)-threonylcarbamoyltransferase complex transferase subunit TsaD [Candidatus Acetothermia bacterium]MCI2432327.1 tRNA (adenosine(37)-N6)-threonylcarbamoyltransferase complex transferase subunit TsaD [Candidatus Acetothermia bacterium]MCI2437316.1 tRNA (adenosine(37)-N6)-threonylcarbamoyltransferase complex transferase subunit TsaD [Candidatus Acetothermia bacterium]